MARAKWGSLEVPAPSWLPALISLSEYGGEWETYETAIYAVYEHDFHRQPPLLYEGQPVTAKKHPPINGKSGTFWHIISRGPDEAGKTPDMARCERIAWARAIVEHADDPAVLVWNEGGYKGGSRTLLWLKDEDYLVVLANRTDYRLLWTAYVVDYEHQRRRLQQSYDVTELEEL